MEALPQETIMQNKIAQAQFVTSDDQGNTYRMQAQDAVQTDPHHVQVRDPLSNMIFEDGTKLSINAATGDYDQETGVFHYKETATLTSTNGYTLKTQELDVNVKDSTAVSKAPVKGQGAGGTINAAGGVVVDKKKKTIAFKGKTTLVIRHGS
jgi:lipopolysaccharide export system protein LptC